MSFKIVTISNREPQQDYYTYKYLQKSAGDNEILVLGQAPGEYTSLSDKPRILYNAIKNGLIKEDKILFIDAWDVIFIDNPNMVMEKYESFNCDVVIGAEKNCFPSNFKKEFDRLGSGSSYKYLNSGVIVGKTDAIMEILEAMDAPNLPIDYHNPHKGNYHFNDQAYYMDIFLRQSVHIQLDYNCDIVQNMQDVKEDEIALAVEGMPFYEAIKPRKKSPIINMETQSCPSLMHWNGGSKTGWSREPILKHLNLI